MALCLDRGATALMSGELVPLKLLPGRKNSHFVLAVGMAAGQEPGRRVSLPSVIASWRGPGALAGLAEKAGTAVAGSC